MNLIASFIRFLARLILWLFLGLLGVLLRVLWPFFLATLRILHALVSRSLIAAVNGSGIYTEMLASEWTRRLIELGVSRDHLDELYGLCRFLAVAEIAIGWIIVALFAVLILRVVFGFFI
jgi:hypothetical protein